jgi:hypothetical protein
MPKVQPSFEFFSGGYTQEQEVIMVTEEQIKELAHAIWEQEGRPEGKDVEHYFRAKQIMEEKENARVIELPPPLTVTNVLQPGKRPKYTRRKKK